MTQTMSQPSPSHANSATEAIIPVSPELQRHYKNTLIRAHKFMHICDTKLNDLMHNPELIDELPIRDFRTLVKVAQELNELIEHYSTLAQSDAAGTDVRDEQQIRKSSQSPSSTAVNPMQNKQKPSGSGYVTPPTSQEVSKPAGKFSDSFFKRPVETSVSQHNPAKPSGNPNEPRKS